MLYPLKFQPILKEVVWGGERLAKAGKQVPKGLDKRHIGESWEISSLEGAESEVAAGPLAGNTLSELLEVYMGELVGDKAYDSHGLEFPVLLKFIDTREHLSVQVHPTNEFAEEYCDAKGKTEMWYVIDATPDGAIYLDVNRPLTEDEYDEAVENGTIDKLLKKRLVHKGEAFMVPAGTIHSIGGGVLLAEVQESSDATFRIYDWGRTDGHGHPRELHTALAAEVANLIPHDNLNITRTAENNSAVQLTACDAFCVNLVKVGGTIELDYTPLDSYVAYMCTEGEVTIKAMGESTSLRALETLLLPAEATDIVITGNATLLEVYTK